MTQLRQHIQELHTNWKDILLQYPNWPKLEQDYENETQKATELTLTVFPPPQDTFNCFNHFNWQDTKVIIIGQDPYHGYGQANGLAFAVNTNIKTPPSLRNILHNVNTSFNKTTQTQTNLLHWAQQGVLLLNSSLSVRESKPGSHSHIWKDFTQWVLSQLVQQNTKAIPVMWGAHAHSIAEKSKLIHSNNTGIITSHPSPLSFKKEYRGYPPFFDSKTFIQINTQLKKNNEKEIDW